MTVTQVMSCADAMFSQNVSVSTGFTGTKLHRERPLYSYVFAYVFVRYNLAK